MKQLYLPTGNEMVSIPKLNQETAAIEDFTFLHMGYKGLVDVRGGENSPLISPLVSVDGTAIELKDLHFTRLEHWIPQFSCDAAGISLCGTVLAPVGERGFILQLKLTNTTNKLHKMSCGLGGTWASSFHCVNEDKEIEGQKHCFTSGWNDSLVFDMRCGVPMFCFAPMANLPCNSKYELTEEGVKYEIAHQCDLEAGESIELNFFWGIGFEEVAAATSAKEMLRQGFKYELDKTVAWLKKRSRHFKDEKLNELYNTNLFFCIFFSTGITVDTEELVLVTSRSPRYYVSAAYWDRDSLLWSFPSILDVDTKLAKKMLMYVFGRQRRNIGVHSRFIDGTVLEPGFELDELMAPVLALESYVNATGDRNILSDANVSAGIDEIIEKLSERKHQAVSLYSTFLQPTDDEHVYPYITYDNVLVWKALKFIAANYQSYSFLSSEADRVKEAIKKHCVIDDGAKKYYAWSVDLEGRHDVYDEPPGSLQLLPSLGFCQADDKVYKNTVDMIRSPQYKYSFAGCNIAEIGCPHAPHPWILSIANSLLCGRTEHCRDILLKISMDNMIACESVNEESGECTTGEAFATCAGFLCHAILVAFGGGENGA